MADEKFVISGPPDVDVPDISFGEYVYTALKAAGNKVAQVDGITNETTTYREILQKSVNLATAFRRMGLGKGDVICICSENRFEFTVTAYAAFYIGGVVSTLNVTYSTDEMKHAMGLSKPRYIVCSPQTAKRVEALTKKLAYVEGLILYGDDLTTKGIPYDSLIANQADVDSFQTAKVDPLNDHMAILCSSGTTGLPKGVMLTHRNFVICAEHLKNGIQMTGRTNETTILFTVMPWFHAYGFVTSCIFVSLHFKLVFAKRFEEELFLRILQEQKITIAMVVPPLVLFLSKHPLVDKYDMSELKELWCGAAPLSKDLQERVIRRLQLDVVKQGYGMTETTLGTLIDVSNGSKPGTAGMVMPGIKAKIVDLHTGEALGPMKEGELCFKGGLMMKGYVGDIASTDHIFDKDGWMHTGDIAYYDEDDFFFIVDRLKELIKYKSFQVPPAELEALLIQHKGVKEAAVVGVPDESAGELPLAFVVRQPGSDITAKEIEEFVAAKVSPAKRLRGGVRFIDEVPKNPSGKMLRRELKERLKRERMSKL